MIHPLVSRQGGAIPRLLAGAALSAFLPPSAVLVRGGMGQTPSARIGKPDGGKRGLDEPESRGACEPARGREDAPGMCDARPPAFARCNWIRSGQFAARWAAGAIGGSVTKVPDSLRCEFGQRASAPL
jgi:hypothetical protein